MRIIADLCRAHSPKKTNFFKVAKIIAYSILLIVEKLNITFTVNRLLCYKPLCAFSCNSLHYRLCYEGTRV